MILNKGHIKNLHLSWSQSNAVVFLYFSPPQEQMVNGVQSPASMPSSSVLLIGSYSLDREILKKLGIGLTLAAAILAFIVEKLYWWSKLEEDCEQRTGQ